MPQFLRYSLCVSALIMVVGCSSTPEVVETVHHFNPTDPSSEEARKRSECMADHSSFNQRQLMVSPAAVESAWVYCFRQSDLWYPGKKEETPKQELW